MAALDSGFTARGSGRDFRESSELVVAVVQSAAAPAEPHVRLMNKKHLME